MGNKRKNEEKDEDTFNLPKRHLTISHQQNQEKRLIVVLERANLESVKVSIITELFYIFLLIIIIGYL